jgi:hypothetical protein
VTKRFGIVHILVASETVEHRLPQNSMATVLAGPRIGEHVACQRGQSKCVVKFAIAKLIITNKPVTVTGCASGERELRDIGLNLPCGLCRGDRQAVLAGSEGELAVSKEIF